MILNKRYRRVALIDNIIQNVIIEENNKLIDETVIEYEELKKKVDDYKNANSSSGIGIATYAITAAKALCIPLYVYRMLEEVNKDSDIETFVSASMTASMMVDQTTFLHDLLHNYNYAIVHMLSYSKNYNEETNQYEFSFVVEMIDGTSVDVNILVMKTSEPNKNSRWYAILN